AAGVRIPRVDGIAAAIAPATIERELAPLHEQRQENRGPEHHRADGEARRITEDAAGEAITVGPPPEHYVEREDRDRLDDRAAEDRSRDRGEERFTRRARPFSHVRHEERREDDPRNAHHPPDRKALRAVGYVEQRRGHGAREDGDASAGHGEAQPERAS